MHILSPQEHTKYWKVILEVGDFKRASSSIFKYEGEPVSYQSSCEDAFKSGNYLLLSDNQIRTISDGKVLLQFRVTLQFSDEFIQKACNMVSGQFPDLDKYQDDKKDLELNPVEFEEYPINETDNDHYPHAYYEFGSGDV